MAIEFRFPDVGEGIHEGKIVEWLVKEGDLVETDQPFVKIETDKAVVELPAPKKGYVLKILFEQVLDGKLKNDRKELLKEIEKIKKEMKK